MYPIARGSAPVHRARRRRSPSSGSRPRRRRSRACSSSRRASSSSAECGGHATLGDLALALAVGGCIAAYTLVDSRGIKYASPIVYQELSMIPAAAGFLLLTLRRRGRIAVRAAVGLVVLRRRARHVRRVHPRTRSPGTRTSGLGGSGTRDERRHRDRVGGATASRACGTDAHRGRGPRRPRRRRAGRLARARHRYRTARAVGQREAPRVQPQPRRLVRPRAPATRSSVPAAASTCRSMCSPVARTSPVTPCRSVWNTWSRLASAPTICVSTAMGSRPSTSRGAGCASRPCRR